MLDKYCYLSSIIIYVARNVPLGNVAILGRMKILFLTQCLLGNMIDSYMQKVTFLWHILLEQLNTTACLEGIIWLAESVMQFGCKIVHDVV